MKLENDNCQTLKKNQELLLKINQMQSRNFANGSSQTNDNDILNIEPLIRQTKHKQDRLRNAYVNTEELSIIREYKDKPEENNYKINNLNLQNNLIDIQ